MSNQAPAGEKVVIHLDESQHVSESTMNQHQADDSADIQSVDASSEQRSDQSTDRCLFDMTPAETQHLKDQLRDYVNGNEAACPFKKANPQHNEQEIDYGYQGPRDDDDIRDEIISVAATQLLMRTPTPHHQHHHYGFH